MVNLFGKGFIGSCYANMFPCIVNSRNDLYPKTKDILYLISTVDNFTFKENPYIDIETNLITLIRVLEKCKYSGYTFNFVSSWFVYGEGYNVDENYSCNPEGFYSVTKRTAEQLLITYCKEFNINYRILRLANVVGLNDKKSSTKKNILNYLIAKIKKDESIDLYKNGEFYRTYIHVEDTCTAINLILEKGELNQIYNIGAYSSKFIDVVDYIMEKTKSKSTVINKADTLVKSLTMNTDKLKSLGFVPKYSLNEILDELVK